MKKASGAAVAGVVMGIISVAAIGTGTALVLIPRTRRWIGSKLVGGAA